MLIEDIRCVPPPPLLLQEHFSAANLMRSLIAEHWRSPLSAAIPSYTAHATAKMVIFSRTGADVSKLGVGGDEVAMMSLVRAAAAAAGIDVPVLRSAACVLQLRGIGSSKDVQAAVNSFVGAGAEGDLASLPHQRVLLLLADMSVVTAPQLNFARQEVRIETLGGALFRVFGRGVLRTADALKSRGM